MSPGGRKLRIRLMRCISEFAANHGFWSRIPGKPWNPRSEKNKKRMKFQFSRFGRSGKVNSSMSLFPSLQIVGLPFFFVSLLVSAQRLNLRQTRPSYAYLLRPFSVCGTAEKTPPVAYTKKKNKVRLLPGTLGRGRCRGRCRGRYIRRDTYRYTKSV